MSKMVPYRHLPTYVEVAFPGTAHRCAVAYSGEQHLKSQILSKFRKRPPNCATITSSKPLFSNSNSPQGSKASAKSHWIAVAKVPEVASHFPTIFVSFLQFPHSFWASFALFAV